jgi:hypothetical protein
LTVPCKDSNYTEIYHNKIEVIKSPHDIFVNSKTYETFEELVRILDEFGVQKKPHVIKECCNVLTNLSYCENLREGIEKDLGQLCEKYTALAKK